VARPGFDRLVAWLRAQKVDAVLCFDPSTVAIGITRSNYVGVSKPASQQRAAVGSGAYLPLIGFDPFERNKTHVERR
jgi:hypothetical protein